MSGEKENLGLRYNSGKLRWRNFPLFLLKPLMQVGHEGEKKYATFNFLKGMKINDLLDCTKRHLEKLESPFESDFDLVQDDETPGTGCHHGALAAWNLLVAVYMLTTRPDLDDRFKIETKENSNGQESK